ncbi:MAG: DNA cytosine methyltransferase [Deltaproteobacteria bacterium]|nr:DNA cytosine methyltransferase [Deltaproteobacteria bacterium]
MSGRSPSLVSLFTGIGGLDLGLEAAGFSVRACVEIDHQARLALSRNRPHWPLLGEGDACRLKGPEILEMAGARHGDVDVLSAGPPCQPFSRAASWRGWPSGFSDPRARTIDALFRIVQALAPRVVLIENVPGFTARHLRELERRLARVNHAIGTAYAFAALPLQAADYGVPQRRLRVFLVAERDGRRVVPPPATHGAGPGLRSVATAWDAIGGLRLPGVPEALRPRGRWARLLPSVPEGANYLHFTARGGGPPLFGWRTRYWSFLLKLARSAPSWTLAARPGPGDGPFHWDNRRLSVPELAALQTLPLACELDCPHATGQRLIGNAVPSALGELLGKLILGQLLGRPAPPELRLTPPRRSDCPRPTRPARLPAEFRDRVGDHPDHPGEGRGPRPWGRRVGSERVNEFETPSM